MFLDEDTTKIDLPALKYLTGECNYGGRVTDDKDVKLIKTLINSYCHTEALADGHKFSKSGIYIQPTAFS